MAGDWIKMQTCLPDKPEVWRIAGTLKIEPDAVIGKLLRVWSWFDSHTENGNAVGVTYLLVDRVAGVTGFAEAMALCGWLEQHDITLTLPKFDRHNGKTAKNRALTNERVAKSRKKATDNVTVAALQKPLPEKRREEVTQSPKPPTGAKSTAVEFKTFIAKCKAENEKPISDYKPLFDYTDRVSLPAEFVQLAWFEFGRIFGDGGVKESRRQKDWRKTFRNYVEKGYLKLWWLNGETFELTTAGKQAQRANAERLAA